jgi:periplasmic protein TonB
MRKVKSQVGSLAFHIVGLAAVAAIGSRSIRQLQTPPLPSKSIRLILPLRAIRLTGDEHGGGGNETEMPARRGNPPPRGRRPFILPETVIHPALPMAQTIAFTRPAPTVDTAETGDPFSRYASGSLGRNGRNSIGDGDCCGIGEGPPGPPGYSSAQLKRMTPPRLLYRVEPEFSEEARKAKYQGVVVLRIDVDTNGRARNIRVDRQLGLGLDEKAVEAVIQWRFEPAYLDGKPMVVTAVVEVNFHLL